MLLIQSIDWRTPLPDDAMDRSPPASSRGRRIKTCALLCLIGGFALEVAGALANHWLLFKSGLFVFLLGLPLYLIGWLLGLRR